METRRAVEEGKGGGGGGGEKRRQASRLARLVKMYGSQKFN